MKCEQEWRDPNHAVHADAQWPRETAGAKPLARKRCRRDWTRCRAYVKALKKKPVPFVGDREALGPRLHGAPVTSATGESGVQDGPRRRISRTESAVCHHRLFATRTKARQWASRPAATWGQSIVRASQPERILKSGNPPCAAHGRASGARELWALACSCLRRERRDILGAENALAECAVARCDNGRNRVSASPAWLFDRGPRASRSTAARRRHRPPSRAGAIWRPMAEEFQQGGGGKRHVIQIAGWALMLVCTHPNRSRPADPIN